MMSEPSTSEEWVAAIAADPDAAAILLRQRIAADPADWKSMLRLAKALRASGVEDEAARMDQQVVATAALSTRHREAAGFLQQGKAFEANRILQALVEGDPDDALAHILFGIQASRAHQIELADNLLTHAAHLVPGYPGARLALADHLIRTKRAPAALAEIRSLPEADQQAEQAQLMIADCLAELGQIEDQLVILRSLSKESRQPLAYNARIGLALRTLGRFDEAAAAFREVISQVPYEGTSWHNLSSLKVEPFSDQDIATMKAGLSQQGQPVENRIRLSFALAKALEDRGDYAGAFAHYDGGNRLRTSISPFDPRIISEWVERSRKHFEAKFFADRRGWGHPSKDPIFVVGMQRSGSTLVEQILSSHPEIEGTAELTDLPTLVRQFSERAAAEGLSYEERLSRLDRNAAAELGADYLTKTRNYRRTSRPLFIDKMPNNWIHVSLIALMLPNAKIIDVRRDPMDCCLSNWKQLYARGLDHSNALETMAQYYADYVELMRHFDRVLPGRIHRVIYEDLVDDVEGNVRRLLDHVGVDFDPAVLDFHQTDRAVRTISAGQVRQPINRKGIGQWRNFEAWIKPLEQALGDVREHWRE